MAKITLLSLILCLVFACSPKGYLISGNLDNDLISDKSAQLTELLSHYRLNAEYVLLAASDGTAVLLTERSFPHLQIDKVKGRFNTTSDLLPPVCALRDIVEISVYNSAFSVESYYTPFSLRMKDFQFLGESSMNGHTVRKYKLKGTE